MVSLLDEVESRLVEERLEHEGVRIHPNTEVAEILGRGGSISEVRTKRGETIGCEMVAVAIGADMAFQPRHSEQQLQIQKTLFTHTVPTNSRFLKLCI